MLSFLRVKFFQFIEHLHQQGFLPACRFAVYHKEEDVPVVKELDDLPPLKAPEEGLELVEVAPQDCADKTFEHPLRSREERCELYFRNGYCGLAMLREGRPVGDLWYVSTLTARTPPIHPDVQRFKLNLAEDEVYMFDMHVAFDHRGEGLATFLMASALHYLHGKGYRKAYGYYSKANIPALWVHRMIGFKELPHFIIRRFLLYRIAKEKD